MLRSCCVHDAMVGHPVKHPRRAAQRQIGALEKEIGFDIRIIKGIVRRPAARPEQDAETLPAQLMSLRSLSPRLVVVFDEFQRLRHCPVTGSIRNALRMMLESSEQPVFGEAVQMQLAVIDTADFLEYLGPALARMTKRPGGPSSTSTAPCASGWSGLSANGR